MHELLICSPVIVIVLVKIGSALSTFVDLMNDVPVKDDPARLERQRKLDAETQYINTHIN